MIHQVVDLADLYALKGSGGAEAQNLDALRAADIPAGGSAAGKEVNSIDPFSYYVGRVMRSFGTDKSKSLLTDLSPYIDRDKKTIKSITGEVRWDYATGLVVVDSPCSKGASGLLGKAGKVALGDVTIESKNEYGSIHVISLDGAPLSASKKILLQAFSEEQSYGWKVANGKIEDVGGPPLNVRNIEATISLKLSGPLKATALDEHGYARKTIDPKIENGTVTITLPADSLYTIIEK